MPNGWPAQQGGAAPRPLPAHPRPPRAPWTATLRALPAIVRAGAAFLALGLTADAGYHLTRGVTPHAHAGSVTGVAFAIHLLVVAGMALCMAGVVAAGVRSARSAHRRRYER